MLLSTRCSLMALPQECARFFKCVYSRVGIMEDTGSVPIPCHKYLHGEDSRVAGYRAEVGQTMGQKTEVANQSQFPNSAHFYPEDGVGIFSLNVGSHKPDYTVP
jgi:hypothetical protein